MMSSAEAFRRLLREQIISTGSLAWEDALQGETPAARVEQVADLWAAGFIATDTANDLLQGSGNGSCAKTEDRVYRIGGQPCRCGKPATRFYSSGGQECGACALKAREALAEACAVPAPAPATHCACGAELMGDRAKARAQCGDCVPRPRVGGTLDQRIAAAQAPAKDHDPTSEWGAGETPSYEWVGK